LLAPTPKIFGRAHQNLTALHLLIHSFALCSCPAMVFSSTRSMATTMVTRLPWAVSLLMSCPCSYPAPLYYNSLTGHSPTLHLLAAAATTRLASFPSRPSKPGAMEAHPLTPNPNPKNPAALEKKIPCPNHNPESLTLLKLACSFKEEGVLPQP
jgi:hypothetical protein